MILALAVDAVAYWLSERQLVFDFAYGRHPYDDEWYLIGVDFPTQVYKIGTGHP